MEKRVQEVTNRTIRNVPYQLKVLDKSIMGSQHFVLRHSSFQFLIGKTKFFLTSDCMDLMLLVRNLQCTRPGISPLLNPFPLSSLSVFSSKPFTGTHVPTTWPTIQIPQSYATGNKFCRCKLQLMHLKCFKQYVLYTV